jgi:hypothetical protein
VSHPVTPDLQDRAPASAEERAAVPAIRTANDPAGDRGGSSTPAGLSLPFAGDKLYAARAMLLGGKIVGAWPTGFLVENEVGERFAVRSEHARALLGAKLVGTEDGRPVVEDSAGERHAVKADPVLRLVGVES